MPSGFRGDVEVARIGSLMRVELVMRQELDPRARFRIWWSIFDAELGAAIKADDKDD